LKNTERLLDLIKRLEQDKIRSFSNYDISLSDVIEDYKETLRLLTAKIKTLNSKLEGKV